MHPQERTSAIPVPELHIREELLTRRSKLDAVRARGATFTVEHLIAQVDAALGRLEAGTFGICQTCHEPIETERLTADPLTCFCLDHLSPPERLQHERDMELAGSIQRALLPPSDTTAAGWAIHYVYEPAGTVSGDYCDIIASRPGEVCIVVGDVSGKGVAASILMSNLHALFRSLSAAQVPFEEVVARVNRIFCESTLPSSFATLAFARLHADGTVQVCNAGHCPPLIDRGGHLESPPPTGPAVGLMCDARFDTVRHTLRPGDTIVLYTDGVTETFDADGNEYGVERLASVVVQQPGAAPRQLAAACLQDRARFDASRARRDDLTLMVVRRLGA
jgi:sigma-B regulation protein RsbU (phosphoserine phosphatase)